MGNLKRTPGPWKASASDPAEGYHVWWITGNTEAHNGEREVCSVAGGSTVSEGDARLIAAAPELLEALKAHRAADKAQEAYETKCVLPEADDRDLEEAGTFALECLAAAREKRDAAIAKAEGRS